MHVIYSYPLRERQTLSGLSQQYLPLQLSWQSRGLKILVSLVRFRPEAPFPEIYILFLAADLAHLVERDLAKVEVAGSSPVIRSNGHSVVTRLQKAVSVICRRHSQAVRQRSAKPLFPSSILGGASKKSCTQVRDFYFLPLTSSLLPKLHSGFFGK